MTEQLNIWDILETVYRVLSKVSFTLKQIIYSKSIWEQWQILFSWAPKSLDGESRHVIKICLLLGRKAMINLDNILKGKDITLLTKGQYNERCYFPHSHVQMWELDHKEGWTLKNWCFQIVVLKMTLESPLDSKEIKSISQGNQPWILIGRTDTEAEAPILWPPVANSRLIGKDPDDGKDWRLKEERVAE